MNLILPTRPEFSRGALRRADLSDDPMEQFRLWFQDAVDANVADPTAMTLATADPSGVPSARIVLLKDLDERGFTFITSYVSAKGRDLDANPRAALVFYWPEVERQVRITGNVERSSRDASERYFRERPRGSQLAVRGYPQSSVIESRCALDARYAELGAANAERDVPMPTDWGGYVVIPSTIEFWQGGVHRLHDRFRYTRNEDTGWRIERLAP